MIRATLPPRDEIEPDTPLRLGVAAALAFPDGSMTASGLRREGERGRLVIERIAGKDYTTLANIERMRELCRVEAKALDYGSAPKSGIQTARSGSGPFGSSGTDRARLARAALGEIARAPSAHLGNISPESTSPAEAPVAARM
jgi:hypothetical protein